MTDPEIPEIPPIRMTYDEALAIERRITDAIGAMDPAEVASIARRLDEATRGHHTAASYVAAVAKVLGPILKGLV